MLCAHCIQDSGQLSIELYTTSQSNYERLSMQPVCQCVQPSKKPRNISAQAVDPALTRLSNSGRPSSIAACVYRQNNRCGSEHSGKGALKAVSENHKETEREASPGKVRKRGRIIQFAPFLCARCSCYCGTINRSSVRINVAWAGTRMSNSLSSKPINACTSATCRRSLSSPTR